MHPAMAAYANGGGGPLGVPGMVPGGVMGGREPSIALARATEAEKTKKERSHSPSRLQPDTPQTPGPPLRPPTPKP